MLAVDEQKGVHTSVLMTLKQFIDYLTKGPKFESKTNLLHSVSGSLGKAKRKCPPNALQDYASWLEEHRESMVDTIWQLMKRYSLFAIQTYHEEFRSEI